ncbi:MAG: MATE family efflux transporter [Tissierellia bacterium]|nr:MATE family efflux transporter [Tissierellia bacterium]
MENKMGRKKMLPLIISMSIPTIFSMFVISLYNIVDSFYISKISEKAFRAVSLVFPIQTIIIALSVGTGIGANALIARYLGMNETKKANIIANNSILLSAIIAAVVFILGNRYSYAFLNMYSTDSEVILYGTRYMKIITRFSFFWIIQIMSEKIIQATGNMFYPMLSQLMGAVINIILDPIMIFGYGFIPSMGIAGAAYATIISQIFGASFCFSYLLKSKNLIHFNLRYMKPDFKEIKNIYIIAAPSILLQAIPAILNFGLNRILIQVAESAVSVMGIFYKLQSFVLMPIFGLTQASMPIIAYNYGARIKSRINDCLKYSIIASLSIMTIGTILFWAIPDKLIKIFNPTDDILEMGIIALKIISTTFILAAISIILSTYYQALGNGFYSLVVAAMRQLIIILPLANIFIKYGINYTWYAWPISEVFSLILCIYLAKKIYRERVKYLK